MNHQNDLSQAKLAEYKALKDESLKRISFRYQIINIILIAAGTFTSLGLQQKSASTLLIYPIISYFLVLSWMHNGVTLNHIGKHIREKIEPGSDICWETQLKANYSKSVAFSYMNTWSVSGLVISTQLLSIILATIYLFESLQIIILLIVDIIILFVSSYQLLKWYPNRERL